MKAWSTVILLISLCFSAGAQDAVKWGEPIRIPGSKEAGRIISGGKDRYYFTLFPDSKKDPTLSIQCFRSDSLQLLYENSIAPIERAESKFTFEKVIRMQGRIIVFGSLYDQKERMHSAHARMYDSLLQPIGEWKELDAYALASSRSLGRYTFALGANDSLLLVNRHVPGKSSDYRSYHLLVTNKDLKELWSQDIELPYTNKEVVVPQILFDNIGNVFMLCAVSSDMRRVERTDAVFSKYLLIGYFQKENIIREYELSLEAKHISAVHARAFGKDLLAISGFYSKKSRYALEGTFYLLLNTRSRTPEKLSVKAFENEVLMELTEDAENEQEEELNNFYFDHFIVNADGSAYLLAEEYYKQTNSYFDPTTQLYYDSYTYHYNDIIVIKLSAEGAIEWARRIAKRQVSAGNQSTYFSYALGVHEGDLYIYFNDHPKNFTNGLRGNDRIFTLSRQQNAQSAEVKVTASGEIQGKALFDDKSSGMDLIPGFCYQNTASTMIIGRKRRNDLQFGRVSLKR